MGDILSKKRELEEYYPIVAKKTEFFSTADANELLQGIVDFAQSKAAKFEVADDKYKVKMTVLNAEDEIELVVNVLKAAEGKHCVEMNKKEGDKFQFYNTFEMFKDYLGDLEDAVY